MVSIKGDDDGSGYGVQGQSPTGTGVVGEGPQWAGVVGTSVSGSGVSAFSDQGAGVLSASNSGPAVSGESTSNDGVVGRSQSGRGIAGASTSGVGVSGQSSSGIGVSGESSSDNGVLGSATASSAAGVFGRNAAEQGGNGIVGLASGIGGIGVFGQADLRGVGVVAQGATGMLARGDSGPGVDAQSTQDHGVIGRAGREGSAGVLGTSDEFAGVLGRTESATSPGVQGENRARGTGVLGITDGPGGGSPAIAGVKGVSEGGAPGVRGESTQGPGVSGVSDRDDGVNGKGHVGVYGQGDIGVTGFGTTLGVHAFGGLGCLGKGNFVGDVTVLGNMTVSGGTKQFLIDHPLDPERRYLRHATVEAPALKTHYDGTADLDDEGHARVELPEWFGRLNGDLCYLLTPLGSAAPDLHVSTEYDGAGFDVAGGPPGGRVSWQVTGVRKDPSAQSHPLVVEADKPPEEVGTYLDPAAYDQPAEASVPWLRQMMADEAALTER